MSHISVLHIGEYNCVGLENIVAMIFDINRSASTTFIYTRCSRTCTSLDFESDLTRWVVIIDEKSRLQDYLL